MNELLHNTIAALRGNIICLSYTVINRAIYKNIVRIFRNSTVEVDKGGLLKIGKGVAIGKRNEVLVREKAVLELGDGVSFNSDCKIVCLERITIGANTIFGPNVMIYDHDHKYDISTGVKRKEWLTSEVRIGQNCWIGAGSIILRGTIIGDNSVVGCGSIVKGIFPNGSRIIQKRVQN